MPPPKDLKFRIHPSIGVARLGDADRSTFFVGPEIPGVPPLGVPPFKNGGLIRPQAARFYIWAYRKKGGKFVADPDPVKLGVEVTEIKWTVHLANRKASFAEFAGGAGETRASKPRRNRGVDAKKLEIDPGKRSITAKAANPGPHGPVKFEPGTSATPASETWPLMPDGTKVIDYLGEIRTDGDGRLLVIGGRGVSRSNSAGPHPINNYANNDTWFDDVSDGPVTAKVTFKYKERGVERTATVDADPAWVLVGPPDYAPFLQNVVTLYDTLLDVAARELALPADEEIFDSVLKPLREINAELKVAGRAELTTYLPSFDDEILPILDRALHARWVFEPGRPPGAPPVPHPKFHTTFDDKAEWLKLGDPARPTAERDAVFAWLRPPPGMSHPAASLKRMPKLLGDEAEPPNSGNAREFLSVTRTQWALLRRWRDGHFIKTSGALPLPGLFTKLTPHGLDRASLEACVGGAFYPGIEVSWQIRAAKLYAAPFRIDHRAKSSHRLDSTSRIKPGHFSRQMALPWQADFLSCSAEDRVGGDRYGWWPAQRPDVVYKDAAAVKAGTMVSWTRANTNWPNSHDPEMAWPDMVESWSKLGFVVPSTQIVMDGLVPRPVVIFLEDERSATIP